MNTLKKTVLTACAIATISFAALGASATGASAGWKKHRLHHFHAHFYKHNYYGHNYVYHCKPKYRKIWVWSPRKGRKVKRLVKVGKWCNGRYYNYY